jgi:5-methylcytosine-specific restriction endonuclease McrA
MSALTLTVDSSAKPVDLVPAQKVVSQIAVDMVNDQPAKLQIIDSDPTIRFRSQDLDIPLPTIVLFSGYVELDQLESNLVSKRVLFARDQWRCQYCGHEPRPGSVFEELTIDHVKPIHLHASKIEATNWENCVTACRECNVLKGGKLPREAKMNPFKAPTQPHFVQLRFSGKVNEPQRDYILDYYGKKAKDWF